MTNPFSSVRWKVLLAFFLIIGLSFLIMAGMLTNMLGRYLFEQRIRADRAGLEKWAVQAAPFLSAADTQTLTQTLAQAGNELSGRVLLLDGDGKVQLDTFPWQTPPIPGGGVHFAQRADGGLWRTLPQDRPRGAG
mgnify:CR=1 FL=1